MLRLRLPLKDGESPESFCSRLAACNGRESAVEFSADHGFRFQEIVDGRPHPLRALAGLGGIDTALLAIHSVRRIGSGRRFEYRGSELTRSTLHLNRILACPECLAHDVACPSEKKELAPFARTTWLITALRTCQIHHRALVDVAPDASLTRADDYAAMIRERIGELEAWMATSTVRSPSSLEEYLMRRLSASHPPSASWLDGMPFYAAVRLCETVGAVIVKGIGTGFRGLTDDEWWQAGKEGFDLLADGPHGIRDLLGQFAASFWDRKGSARGKAWLGRLHEWLNNEVAQDASYEPVRTIIRDHLIETLPLGPGDEILGQPVTERRLWSVHSAAREIGAHPKRLRTLLAESGFIPGNKDLTDDRATFPADQKAEAFLARVRGAMPVLKARTYINAPRVQFAILFDAGVIQPFIRGGTETLKDHAFAKADLDDFLARLLIDAADATEADDDLVDIPTCPRHARCTVDDVVRLILDRRLSRIRRRPDVSGFLSVLVDPAEVRSLIHHHSSEYVSLEEVELTTPWSDKSIKGLLDYGCLPFEVIQNSYNHLTQRVVKRSELERFMSTYVSLMGLGEERGEHFLAVKRWLERQGVQPAFPPDQVAITMYRRADIPGMMTKT